jgi:hypothetical protein
MSQDINPLSPKAQKALAALKKHAASAPPYMTARVLEQLDDQRQKRPQWGWFFSKAGIALACLIIGVFIGQLDLLSNSLSQEQPFVVGQSYVIRLDLRPFKPKDIANIQLDIEGPNMKFSSHRHENLDKMKTLVLDWIHLSELQFLPIVVTGTEEGPASLQVKFLDKHGQVIGQQNFNFDFMEKT